MMTSVIIVLTGAGNNLHYIYSRYTGEIDKAFKLNKITENQWLLLSDLTVYSGSNLISWLLLAWSLR